MRIVDRIFNLYLTKCCKQIKMRACFSYLLALATFFYTTLFLRALS